MYQKLINILQIPLRKKHILWTGIWLLGILSLWIWNILFLNAPDLLQIQTAVFNTFLMSLLVVIFSVFLGWVFSLIRLGAVL